MKVFHNLYMKNVCIAKLQQKPQLCVKTHAAMSLSIGGRLLVERVFALGVAREPSLLHPLLLLEDFENRPKRGKCRHAEQGRGKQAADDDRQSYARKPQQQEPPPTASAEVVFAFNHYGVEQPYYKESAKAYGEAEQVVIAKKFHISVVVGKVEIIRPARCLHLC